jgi:hypothetical protein
MNDVNLYVGIFNFERLSCRRETFRVQHACRPIQSLDADLTMNESSIPGMHQELKL